jgi:WD40 repeat protein
MREAGSANAKPSVDGLLKNLALQTVLLHGRHEPLTLPLDLTQLPPTSGYMSWIAGGSDATMVMLAGGIVLPGMLLIPTCMAATPDGKTLVVGGMTTRIPFGGNPRQDSVILIWNMTANKMQSRLTAHEGAVTALAVSPDGRLFASAGFDKGLRVWDTATGKQKALFRNQPSVALSLAFSADSQTLISGYSDGTVKLWRATTLQRLTSFNGHQAPVSSVVLGKDGRTLASASLDGTIKIWDASATPGPIRKNLEGGIGSLAIKETDGTLAAVNQDGLVTFHDAVSGQSHRDPIHLKAGEPRIFSYTSAFAPQARRVAMADLMGRVVVYDVPSGKKVREWKVPNGHTFTLAFSPDGNLLALGRGDSQKSVWKHIWTFIPSKALGRGDSHESGEVLLYDVASGQKRATLAGYRHHVLSLAFAPDGKTLAGGSQDGTVKVWDTSSAAELGSFSLGKNGAAAVAFSHDGRRLAVAAESGISLRDAQTGKEVLLMRSYSHHVVSMSFSPDDKRLATAGGEEGESGRGGGVKLWDLISGQEVLALGGPTDTVRHILFSPDGRQLYATRTMGLDLGVNFQQSSELLIWKAAAP